MTGVQTCALPIYEREIRSDDDPIIPEVAVAIAIGDEVEPGSPQRAQERGDRERTGGGESQKDEDKGLRKWLRPGSIWQKGGREGGDKNEERRAGEDIEEETKKAEDDIEEEMKEVRKPKVGRIPTAPTKREL